MEQGPLGLMHNSVMAWVINHQPSPRLTGFAMSWSCLPTQPMAPDSVNVASHALPKLSPPKIAAHRTGWPCLGQSLLLQLGWICHPRSCLPQPVPARCMGGVVPPSLVEITCISKQY